MYARKMRKKTAVPIRLCFVDTGSSLGTGMNENMSILVRTLMGSEASYCFMNDSFIKDLSDDMRSGYYSLIGVGFSLI
jgi:hypothetical protein